MTYPMHSRPRDRRGRYEPGWTLWQRADGEASWVRWLGPEDEWEPPNDLRAARGCFLGLLLVLPVWLAVLAVLLLLVVR